MPDETDKTSGVPSSVFQETTHALRDHLETLLRGGTLTREQFAHVDAAHEARPQGYGREVRAV